jgi:hypothetical protein
MQSKSLFVGISALLFSATTVMAQDLGLCCTPEYAYQPPQKRCLTLTPLFIESTRVTRTASAQTTAMLYVPRRMGTSLTSASPSVLARKPASADCAPSHYSAAGWERCKEGSRNSHVYCHFREGGELSIIQVLPPYLIARNGSVYNVLHGFQDHEA